MNKKLFCIILFLAVLTTSLMLTSSHAGDDNKDQPWKKFLPPKVYQELVDREVQKAEKAIGGDFKKLQQGKVAAILLAGYTLSAGKDVKADLNSVRAAALKLGKLLGENGKKDEIKSLLAAIQSGKGSGSIKDDEINFKFIVPSDYDLMVPYMERDKGGDGLHKDLQFSSRLRDSQEFIENLFSYLAKRPLKDSYLQKAADELVLTGYRTAVSAELIYTYAPVRKKKDRDPAVWRKTSIDMRNTALNLAEASAKKDADGIYNASTALLKSCVECHKVFQN